MIPARIEIHYKHIKTVLFFLIIYYTSIAGDWISTLASMSVGGVENNVFYKAGGWGLLVPILVLFHAGMTAIAILFTRGRAWWAAIILLLTTSIMFFYCMGVNINVYLIMVSRL